MSRTLTGEKKRDLSQNSQGLNSILELIWKINVIKMKVEFFFPFKYQSSGFEATREACFPSGVVRLGPTRGDETESCVTCDSGDTEHERPLAVSSGVEPSACGGTASGILTSTRSQKNKLYLKKKKNKNGLLFVFLSRRLASSKHQKHPGRTNTEISNNKSVFLGHRSIRSALQKNNNNNICLFFTIKTLCPKGV